MAKELEFETLKCQFCGRDFEFRLPRLDWPTPACDECLIRNPSRGRVVRRVPAKHFQTEFDSPLEVQIDRGNLRCWMEMRESYEKAQAEGREVLAL